MKKIIILISYMIFLVGTISSLDFTFEHYKELYLFSKKEGY